MLDEKLLTNWRIQFVEFTFQLGSFLLNVRSTGMQQQHLKELTATLDQCLKMSRIPDQEGRIVIRFRGRGIPGESGDSEKYDYVFRYGSMEIDIPLIKKVARRGGVTTSHLPWRLLKSFEHFAALDINSLFLDIGTCQDEELSNVRLSLEIMGNYLHVVEFGSEQVATTDLATPIIVTIAICFSPICRLRSFRSSSRCGGGFGSSSSGGQTSQRSRLWEVIASSSPTHWPGLRWHRLTCRSP